jgi:hypothetical protein
VLRWALTWPPTTTIRSGTLRGRHRKKNHGQGRIRHPITMAERPAHVEDRIEFGHWEGGLIIGNRSTEPSGPDHQSSCLQRLADMGRLRRRANIVCPISSAAPERVGGRWLAVIVGWRHLCRGCATLLDTECPVGRVGRAKCARSWPRIAGIWRGVRRVRTPQLVHTEANHDAHSPGCNHQNVPLELIHRKSLPPQNRAENVQPIRPLTRT